MRRLTLLSISILLLASRLAAQTGTMDLIIDTEGVRRTGHTRVEFRPGTTALDPQFKTGGGLGVGLDYFLGDHFSLEGKVAGLVTRVHLRFIGADTVSTLDLKDAQLYPITAIIKWHFTPMRAAFQPYLGAGVGHVILRDIDTSTLRTINARELHFKDPTGLVVAGGVLVRVSRRWALSADARYIPLETKSTASLVGTNAETADLNLRPLMVGFGLAYRF